jgi:TonB family protein
MKRLPLFISLFLATSLSAQKTEQLYDYNWKLTTDPGKARYYGVSEKRDSIWIRQDYFIREMKLQMMGSYKDAENKIAHGMFYFYHPNGVLASTGEYVDGKKNGLWTGYHNTGMMKDSIVYVNGNPAGTAISWFADGYISDSTVYNEDGSGLSVSWFSNGSPAHAGIYSTGRKKQGKWKYFHRNGNPSSVEIFDNGKLLSKEYFDEDGKPLSDTTSRDRDAAFPGGDNGWKKYLSKRMSFPARWVITGGDRVTVVVDFTVDEDGKVENAVVTAPVHPELDKQALDIIMKSPKWIPAISHNRRVKAFRRQPLTFIQSD